MKTIKWYKVKCSLINQCIGIKTWNEVIEFLEKHRCFDYTIMGQTSDIYCDVNFVYKDGILWEKDKIFFKDIVSQIQSTFIGSEWQGEEYTENMLNEIVGIKCECYDIVFDDCIDEEADSYVMKASFHFENSPLVVSILFGNVTEEICYVKVRNAESLYQ
jgi:hypothetical protein